MRAALKTCNESSVKIGERLIVGRGRRGTVFPEIGEGILGLATEIGEWLGMPLLRLTAIALPVIRAASVGAVRAVLLPTHLFEALPHVFIVIDGLIIAHCKEDESTEGKNTAEKRHEHRIARIILAEERKKDYEKEHDEQDIQNKTSYGKPQIVFKKPFELSWHEI